MPVTVDAGFAAAVLQSCMRDWHHGGAVPKPLAGWALTPGAVFQVRGACYSSAYRLRSPAGSGGLGGKGDAHGNGRSARLGDW